MIAPATPRGVALARLAARLSAAGVADASREAALLLRSAAGLSASDLISAPEAPLGPAAAQVEAFARRREAGEPLARIEGRRAFWRHEFAVTPDVLDPRADTETLVEAALAAMRTRAGEALRVLDFGVGSGAILAALLGEWPSATGLGVDLSRAAAAVAERNLAALGLSGRARVRVGNWGEGLAGAFDVIVANPPYIRDGDIAELAREVREHDPRLALAGGADGLDAYRALAPEIVRLLAPDGRFFLEIGAGQGDAVAAILSAAGLQATERRRDLGGIERVLAGAKSGLRDAAAAVNIGGLANAGVAILSDETLEQPSGDLTVRLIAMPADTNANGDIFGGWVLSQMDQAGGIAAVERAQGRVVTIAVDAMTFIRPVKVGDVLCVYTRVEKVGRTSMKIHIEAWARRFRSHVAREGDGRDVHLRRHRRGRPPAPRAAGLTPLRRRVRRVIGGAQAGVAQWQSSSLPS